MNERMRKKLLYKTSKAYLLYSALILFISAPVFYYSTEKIYLTEADDTLELHKKEFLNDYVPTLKKEDIPVWNKYNRNVKIENVKGITRDTFFFTSYYDTLDAEMEPYRELHAPIEIQGQPYTYTARINLVETEDLVKNSAILFLAILLILLVGLFLITKWLSSRLWKPFYKTLQQIEDFEIDKNKQPELPATGVEEFSRLNASIQKLIEKNTIIYKSQREFIENAAHELQTPLAVFQAKIDTLIQGTEVTQAQSEILAALNENISRLNRLNKNLLLLSKIENDNYTDRQPIVLSDYIRKNLDFFTEQANAKQLVIKAGLMDGIHLQANPVLTEMLISNLFLNAIRHNIQGGQIIVSTDLSNGRDQLTFSNSGQTQPLDTNKLFNRFSKANPSGQGTGLGLSIVKKIADLHNWTVSYHYAEGFHSFSILF